MALLQLVPWFDEAELQQIAALFFPAVGLSEDEAVKSKERGVAIVTNWKHRINHPSRNFIYIQATSELTAAILNHAKCRNSIQQPSINFAIRASYSQAISRFITTICDKENSGMHKAARQIDLPPYLVDLRHAIVHRLEPTLIELKAAAEDCLRWLRGSFWDGLRVVNGNALDEGRGFDQYGQWMMDLIEFYYSNRKAEIKSGGIQQQHPQTSEVAVETRARLFAVLLPSGSVKEQESLLRTFVGTLLSSRRFWPKEINQQTMASAIMMWDPLLLALSGGHQMFLSMLLQLLVDEMIKPTRMVCSEDSRKNGLFHWVSYLLQQGSPDQPLSASLSSRKVDIYSTGGLKPWSGMLTEQHRIGVLDRCIVEPGPWTNQLRDLIVGTLPARLRKDYQEFTTSTTSVLGEETEPESLQAATERIMRMAALDQDADAQSSILTSEPIRATNMAKPPTTIRPGPSIADESAGTSCRGWRLQKTAVIPRPIGVCRSAAVEALLKA